MGGQHGLIGDDMSENNAMQQQLEAPAKVGPGTESLTPEESANVDAATAALQAEGARLDAVALEAEWYLVANVRTAAEAMVNTRAVIKFIKDNSTFERRTMPNGKAFTGWKPYVRAKLTGHLVDWSTESIDAFVVLLVDAGFEAWEAGQITKVSESKARRAIVKANAEAQGKPGKPQPTSTVTSRLTKAQDSLITALPTVDKVPTADLRNAILSTVRTLDLALLEYNRRGKVDKAFPHLVAVHAALRAMHADQPETHASSSEGNNPVTGTPAAPSPEVTLQGAPVDPATTVNANAGTPLAQTPRQQRRAERRTA